MCVNLVVLGKLYGKLRCFPEKFTQLAQILHDRRSWRSRQISTLSIGATYLPNPHKPHLFRFSFSILLLLGSSCQLNHHDKLDQMKSLLNRGEWGKASKKVLENILQCGLARVLSKGKFCQSRYLNNNSGDQMIPICSLTLKKLLSSCQDVVNSFLNNRVKNITRFGLKPATARVTSTEFNQK